ncbi:tail assembly chaperone [Stenotrophomonas phage vB_SmaS_Bhz59]
MSGLYAQYKTDPKLEVGGIFIDVGKNSKGEDTRFKIARAGGSNVQFQKALERETKPYKRAIQTKTLSDALAHTIYLRAFVAGVLLGWEGVEDENNQPLQFTFDNALKLFTDLPDLFAQLKEDASDVSLFREEVLEADLGKSGPSSSTASS